MRSKIEKKTINYSKELCCDEINEAKVDWIKNEQQTIINDQKRMKQLNSSLQVFMDSGVLRLRGRMQNADLEYDNKYPIYLDKSSFLTELLIKDAHLKVKHSLTRDTLNEFRSSYWVNQGRRTVKRVIAKCVRSELTNIFINSG